MFTVHITYKNKTTSQVQVTVEPGAGADQVPTLEEFADTIMRGLTDADEVMQFKQPTLDGAPGFLLVPVRAVSSLYVS